MGAQIGAEEVNPAMLTKVVAGGNMRRDDNAFIVPETAVGLAFELADIHVQGDAPSLPSPRATTIASSSMISPRATLARIVFAFIAAKASRPIRLVVSGVH
jgi:hypothetical protein